MESAVKWNQLFNKESTLKYNIICLNFKNQFIDKQNNQIKCKIGYISKIYTV